MADKIEVGSTWERPPPPRRGRPTGTGKFNAVVKAAEELAEAKGLKPSKFVVRKGVEVDVQAGKEVYYPANMQPTVRSSNRGRLAKIHGPGTDRHKETGTFIEFTMAHHKTEKIGTSNNTWGVLYARVVKLPYDEYVKLVKP